MTFIPKSRQRPPRTTLPCYCQWCAVRGARKTYYKLRDGPLDWFFCTEDHALNWLEHRHKTLSINAMLKLTPAERHVALGGLTIEEFCSKELS